MQKLGQIYEGKAKKVYQTDVENQYIVEYKDDATAFNGEKKGIIAGKGIINNRMSNLLFKVLAEHQIPTHFVEEISDRETVVQAVEIIPLEVVVRNRVAGSLAKRLDLEEGRPLPRPLVEFYYKNDALGDPLITEDQITLLGFAADEDLATLKRLARQIDEVLSEFLLQRQVLLIDFKLEFGRTSHGQIVLADEISPDTCRFWDAKTLEKLDKDRFRRDLGGVQEAYQEIMRRIQGGN